MTKHEELWLKEPDERNLKRIADALEAIAKALVLQAGVGPLATEKELSENESFRDGVADLGLNEYLDKIS
ncbi:MAG: hypothetical protein AAF719_01200 [Pseudomonadota bacterium]